MSIELILHHYPESPFAEKIRSILGYKNIAYQSVAIPIIMPKPDVITLTGGYRKTPILQIGADIYCDTALIARVIDHHFPENPLRPDTHQAGAVTMAQWSDQNLFRMAVTVAFQPRGIATNRILQDEKKRQEFMAERAEFRKGPMELGMTLGVAQSHFLTHLKRIDNQLSEGESFLFGDSPCIADFSTYHCLWFIYSNKALRDIFDPFPNVCAWRERMEAFGNGNPEELSSTSAIEIATTSNPEILLKHGAGSEEGLTNGDEVEVVPTDYGINPVRGKLLMLSYEEIVVKRENDVTGATHLHFPRMGFQVSKI